MRVIFPSCPADLSDVLGDNTHSVFAVSIFLFFFFIHARFRIRGELPPNRKFRCFPKFFICTTIFLKSIPTFEAHRLRRIAAIHNWTSIVFLVDALTSASRTYIKRYSNSNPAIFRIVNTDERSSLIFVLTANGKR